MNELVRCREMASLCRQRSAFYHDEKWAWLARAKMWDALGDQEIEHHKMARLAVYEAVHSTDQAMPPPEVKARDTWRERRRARKTVSPS